MRQYTDNSPGCSTANYTNVGGKRQNTTLCWKPVRARRTVTDRIGTVTDCISTVTARICTVTGGIGTQTRACLSQLIDLYQSLCNRRHSLSVLRVFFPKKPEPIHFLQAMRSSRIFSCKGSFFFGRSLKRLSAYRFGCEHRRFYVATSDGLVWHMYSQT